MSKVVVAAIVEWEGKILVGKKIECEHPAGLGGKWHLPGGQLEKDETPKQAIVREIKEEADIEVEITKPLGSKISNITGSTIMWFLCSAKSGDIVADDDLEEARWVSRKEVIEICPEVAKDAWSEEVWEYLRG